MLCYLGTILLIGQPARSGAMLSLYLFVIIAILFIGLMQVILLVKSLKKATPGFALIRTGIGGIKVTFDAIISLPFLHQCDLVNISCRKMRYERTGSASVIFSDQKRIDLIADLMLRINKDATDVKFATAELGVELLNDSAALRDYFSSSFNDAIETVAGQMTSKEFFNSRESFREQLFQTFGNAVNGMTVDDIAIHHAEPAN